MTFLEMEKKGEGGSKFREKKSDMTENGECFKRERFCERWRSMKMEKEK